MSAEGLIAAAESAGLTLEPREGGILHVSPRARLTPALREALKASKADVLALLRQRQAQEALGIDWSRVSLYQLDKVLEVAVPWSDIRLVIAPGCRIARELRAQDARPGRVWCVCEILDLILAGVSPEDARKIAEAKSAVDGALVSIRRASPPAGPCNEDKAP